MRLFFIFLLVLNGVFAAWQYYVPEHASKTESPFPEQLNRLVILKEAVPEAVAMVEEVTGETSEKQVAEQMKAVKSCYTLGPYEDRELVDKIRQELGDVIDFAVREREEKELHRYWVYLSGEKGRAHARKVSMQLAQNNIKDYYILQTGDIKNSISLGHFKDKAYADIRVREIKRLGLDPRIEVIYREYSLYWLDYALAEESGELAAKIQEYLVDGVTLLNRQCEGK